MYIFIILTVLAVALGTSAIAFYTSVNQIDNYYKQNTADNARNFATFVDGDFLMRLREAAETDEFQALRDTAEEEDDEDAIRAYLEEHGLWEEYSETQNTIDRYLGNIGGIKYLYINACGDENATLDMYLVDDSTNPIYETGYYEEREPELVGMDLTKGHEPIISNGDWGWLCSAFSPVYTSDGRYVACVGCDFDMEEVMLERRNFLIYMALGTILFTGIVMIAAVILSGRLMIKPLNTMTTEMKKFKPAKNTSYKEAGVIELDLKANDEISEIYEGIRSMQTNIIDYLTDLSALEEDKKRAEQDIMNKEEEIGRLSEETYKDPLTGVGSKAAYFKHIEELNRSIAKGTAEFALVMVDMNNLKQINDDFGHKSGDLYIKGCCDMVSTTFANSPVFRIGGDEFVVIVQGEDYKRRFELFDGLKAGFAGSYADTSVDPWCRYSAALGMAENASDDVTTELVFKRADKAMYADKMKFKAEHGSYR